MLPIARRWYLAALFVLGAAPIWQSTFADADANPQKAETPSSIRPAQPIVPRSNVLTDEPWRGIAIAPLSSGELDELVASELRADKIAPAEKTSDEVFLRRVTLDLTGKLPTAAEIGAFVQDRDPTKRSKVIDKLLDSEAYSKHWAKYWRDVVSSSYTDRRQLGLVPELERWLVSQFQANTSWRDMTRSMLTAEGAVQITFGGPLAPKEGNTESNGAAVFLLAHLGEDQSEERAAETSRVFLGIRIQCAQCHDHPFDEWKQKQFHQLAGYFSRMRSRQVVRPGAGPPRIELLSLPYREHRQPDKNDPKKGTTVLPKFLNGHAPKIGLGDLERRTALANEITAPENFWFAAAFVNRMWSELMGQSFSQPVDDLGPGRDVVMPTVLVKLSASFRASNYDIKQLLRTICNCEAYQRQMRPGESVDEHLHFAASYPTRLRAEALWQSLVNVLGPIGGVGNGRFRPAAPANPIGRAAARAQSVESSVLNEFRYDPSLKPDEVEGSISQALLLMNNPQLLRAMQAQGSNSLGTLLRRNPKDEDAIRALYLKALARRPSESEMSKASAFVKKTGNREEAFEDLLWALINSTEFQTKR